MIRITGVLLVVLCSSMTGMVKASKLSDRVRWIEDNIRLLNYLADRLKYLQPSVQSLIGDAAVQFPELPYLADCAGELAVGTPFPAGWRHCVERCSADQESVQILVSLDQVLGGMDLESQLTALDYTRELLGKRLEEARDYRDRHGKLYRTLGVLCGLALAIVLL